MDFFCATDIESDHPAGGFDRMATVFANKLARVSPAIYALGIFGDFGVGKTTLLKAIMRQVEKLSATTPNESLVPVWFEAWRHATQQGLSLPLLHTIRGILLEHNDQAGSEVLNAFRGLAEAAEFNLGVVKIKANEAIEKGEAQQDGARGELNKAIGSYHDVANVLAKLPTCGDKKRRFVMFIDDLDRCSSELAFNLLEDIRRFFGIEGFVFVVAMNPKAVRNHLAKTHGGFTDADTRKWLEKIFQEEFPLWPEAVRDGENLQDFLATRDIKFHDALRVNSLAAKEYFPSNLRELKRMCNAYWTLIALYDEINDGTDHEAVLTTLAFRSRWPAVYAAYILHSGEIAGATGGAKSWMPKYCAQISCSADCAAFFDDNEALISHASKWVRPDYDQLCDKNIIEKGS